MANSRKWKPSEEQRLRANERKRMRDANMSAEEKRKKLDLRIQRLRNLTPEQRKIRSQQQHKWNQTFLKKHGYRRRKNGRKDLNSNKSNKNIQSLNENQLDNKLISDHGYFVKHNIGEQDIEQLKLRLDLPEQTEPLDLSCKSKIKVIGLETENQQNICAAQSMNFNKNHCKNVELNIKQVIKENGVVCNLNNKALNKSLVEADLNDINSQKLVNSLAPWQKNNSFAMVTLLAKQDKVATSNDNISNSPYQVTNGRLKLEHVINLSRGSENETDSTILLNLKHNDLIRQDTKQLIYSDTFAATYNCTTAKNESITASFNETKNYLVNFLHQDISEADDINQLALQS